MTYSINSGSGDLMQEAYSWLLLREEPIQSNADLTTLTSEFIKNQGKVRDTKEAIAATLEKAFHAFSFVKTANALREDKTLSQLKDPSLIKVGRERKDEIKTLFDRQVGEGKSLILPSNLQIDQFSQAWESFNPKSQPIDHALKCFKEVYGVRRATLISTLYAFKSDPHLKFLLDSRSIANVADFIRKEYSALEKHVVDLEFLISKIFEEFDKEVDAHKTLDHFSFNLMLEKTFKDHDLLKRQLTAFDSITRTALESPEVFRLALLNKQTPKQMFEICETRNQLVDVFKKFKEEDLRAIRGYIEKKKAIPEKWQKKTILLAHRFNGIPYFNVDQYNRHYLSKDQLALLDLKDKVLSAGYELAQTFIENYLKESLLIEDFDSREVTYYSQKRDENHITEQFHSDGHRFGCLEIQGKLFKADPHEQSLEKNAQTRSEVLQELRKLADPDMQLYATVQEMICQNVENLSTSLHLRRYYLQQFGELGVEGFLMNTWNKEKLTVNKIDGNHFTITHDYKVELTNMATYNTSNQRVRFTYRVYFEEGQWVVSQPFREPINLS